MSGYEHGDQRGNGRAVKPLSAFASIADVARMGLPNGEVDWSESPFPWMIHIGPRTKSRFARDMIEDWLGRNGVPFELPQGPGKGWHVTLRGIRYRVQIGITAMVPAFEYSALHDSKTDVDATMLLGIEPKRVRIWKLASKDVDDLPRAPKRDADHLHNLSFPVDEPPAILTELERWEWNEADAGQLELV